MNHYVAVPVPPLEKGGEVLIGTFPSATIANIWGGLNLTCIYRVVDQDEAGDAEFITVEELLDYKSGPEVREGEAS